MPRVRQLWIGVIAILLVLLIQFAGSEPSSTPFTSTSPRSAALPGAQVPESPNQEDKQPGPDIVIYAPVEPVTVNMGALPPGTGIGDSKYERWLRGEIKLEKEERFSDDEIARLQASAMGMAPDANVQRLGSDIGLDGPVLGIGFESLDVDDCCGSGATVPPDPELSAGPNHLIAVVNVSFEIYDKGGTSLAGPTLFSSLFAALPAGNNCSGSKPFDPNTLYDEQADRFLLAVDGDGKSYCVAVSQTGDPTGAWSLYEFSTDVGGLFFDYPHAGIGQDAIYLGANLFAGDTYVGGRIWALDKAAMYAGSPANAISRSLGTDGTPQPINLHGFWQGGWPSGGPHYILTDGAYDGRVYRLYSWSDPFGANELVMQGDLDLAASHGVNVSFPVNSVQAGSGGDITANDYRVLDFEYRNGSGWTAMTVACNPGTGTVNCVQWAEVDLSSASIVQAGVFASDGDYRTFPDVAANHCGDMIIGYSKSGATSFPSVWVTGREAGDSPGEVQTEIMLKGGEVTYTAFADRWGDYTGMTSDPDGLRLWYIGEYSKNLANSGAKWGTFIGALTFPGCQVPASFTLGVSPLAQDICAPESAVFEIQVNGVGAFADPVTLSVAGVPPGYVESILPNPVTPSASSQLTLTNVGPVAAAAHTLAVTGVASSDTMTTSATLNVFDGPPHAPLLQTPSNGAHAVPASPRFSWTELLTASSYLLEVATDPGFQSIVYSATITSASHTPTVALSLNTAHYWRVTGFNVCGPSISTPAHSFVTARIVCSSPGLDLPDADPDGIGDQIFIAEPALITELDVLLDISHTWVGDLAVSLAHGPVATGIVDRPGMPDRLFGCGGDDIAATLDDEGTDGSVETSCGNSSPAIAGLLTPHPDLLASFDGTLSAGVWELNVSDHAAGDTGVLNSWCLIYATSPGHRQLFLPAVMKAP